MAINIKFTEEEIKELQTPISIEQLSELIDIKTNGSYVIAPHLMFKDFYRNLCYYYAYGPKDIPDDLQNEMIKDLHNTLCNKWADELTRLKLRSFKKINY